MVGRGLASPANLGLLIGAFNLLEALAGISATVLWLLMFYDNLTRSGTGLVRRVLWAIGLMLTIWFGAQFYYLLYYNRANSTGGQGEKGSA